MSVTGPEKKQIILEVGDDEDILVNANATVYSKSFSLKNLKVGTLSMIATSGGVVDVTVSMEYGLDEYNVDAAATATYAIDESGSDMIQITDEVIHHLPFNPIAIEWARLKFVGGATNAATTYLRNTLSEQREH